MVGKAYAIVLSPPPHPGGGEEGDHSALTIMLRVSELYLAAGVNNPYDSMYTGVFLSKTGLSTRGKIPPTPKNLIKLSIILYIPCLKK